MPDVFADVKTEFRQAYKLHDELSQIAYKFDVLIDEPEIFVHVSYGVEFAVASREPFEDDESLVVHFGQAVGFPVAYPFLREKVIQLTNDAGVRGGLMLPLWRNGDAIPGGPSGLPD